MNADIEFKASDERTNCNDLCLIPSTSVTGNDYVLPSLPPKNMQLDRSRRSASREPMDLESICQAVIIQSVDSNAIPFVVEGGSENSQLIYIGQVLSVELMGRLGYGDVILAIDGIKIAGRVLSEVSAFLYTIFSSAEEVRLDYLPAGTTRPQNSDEINGENYHFISLRSFLQLLRHGAFLEHASYDGHLYGTPRPELNVRDYDSNYVSVLKSEAVHPDNNDQKNAAAAELIDTSFEMTLQTDSRGPLPPNWEAAYSENGENHNTGTTQWEDPRDESGGDSKSVTTISDTSTPTTIAAAPSASAKHIGTVRLPPGWERVDDEVHGTFYVDHINKRTQYEPPPPQFDEAPTARMMKSAGHSDQQNGAGIAQNGTGDYQLQQQQRFEMNNGVASTSTRNMNFYGSQPHNHAQLYGLANGYSNGANGMNSHYGSGSRSHLAVNENGNGVIQADNGLLSNGSAPIWQRDQNLPTLRRNGGYDNGVHGAGSSPYGEGRQKQRAQIPYLFTNDVNQLRGEILTTIIQKGMNGLGFTLIGNDGSNTEPEFIQVKTILPNGAAARNGVLEPGDVLVFVNNEFMLGASQEDACRAFRAIPPGEPVQVQVCRGYPYPASKIYTVATNFQNRSRDNIEVDLKKGPKGFGFTITDSLQGQRVKTVLFPDYCPNLMEGDLILEINGQNVKNIAHAELVEMLQNFGTGTRLRMLVSRNTGRHRSRTPTAGFRYGEQRPASNVVVAPRSKTPAPTSSGANRLNGADAAAINRNNVFQQQQQHRPLSNYDGIGQNWNATMPKAPRQEQPIYGDIRKYQQQQNGNGRPIGGYMPNSQMRNSSSSLGFSSTPNYIPASALTNAQSQMDWQFIVVNLIVKDGGFGFHLLSDEQNSPLIVGPIVAGGAAREDGRLQPGDEIVEIDGQPARNFNYTTAVNAIKAATNVGHVKLVVRRRRETNLYGTYGGDNILPLVNGTVANGFSGAENGTMTRVKSQSRGSRQARLYDVHLAKLEHEDFGITIISQNHRYIGSIDAHSPAARCGLLRAGDCISAINGYSVSGMTHQQVINFMRSSGNAITLTIDPSIRMTPVQSAAGGGPNGDEIDSLVSMMAAVTNGTLRSGKNVPLNNCDTINKAPQATTELGCDASKEKYINVSLSRGTKGFGFSIRGGMEFNEMPIFVLRIADDGPAAIDGRLRVGDQLVQINGENTVGMTHQRAIQLITQDVTVQLVILRRS